LTNYTIFNGDHNACYVDLNSASLFSDETYNIAPPSTRSLRLSDPRLVEKYAAKLSESLAYHNIPNKVDELAKIPPASWSASNQQQYEAIDITITEAMQSSECSLARYRTTHYDWSDPLSQAVHAVRYWKLHIKRKSYGHVTDHRLQTTLLASGLPATATADLAIPQLLKKLREARAHLCTSCKSHTELRDTYLHALAEAIILKRCPFLHSPKYQHIKAERVAKEIRELINVNKSGGCTEK
jgi:hypothetical protein